MAIGTMVSVLVKTRGRRARLCYEARGHDLLLLRYQNPKSGFRASDLEPFHFSRQPCNTRLRVYYGINTVKRGGKNAAVRIPLSQMQVRV